MTQNKITDGRSDRKYFTITPRLIGLLCQDVYEYTLWCIIKEIAGEKGECYLGTEDLADLAMQSMGKVSQARRRLIEAGLLQGEIRRDPGFQQSVWHLRIPDLWPKNIKLAEELAAIKDRVEFKRQQKRLHQVKPSPGERAISPGERATTPGETKKNQEEEPKVEPTEKPCGFLPEQASPESKPPETPTDQHMTRLREKFGADPLEAMTIAAEQTKTNDRPTGWEFTRDDSFAICQRVADLWTAGKLPSGTWGGRIEKWAAGAAELLRYHDDDLQAALLTLDRYHLHYEEQGLTFTVAGPQSLLNVIPPFMAGGAKRRKPGRSTARDRRRGQRDEYEPCTGDERKAAWDSYGDALLAWIKERGTDENLGPCGPAIARSLGLDGGTVQALIEAYIARRARAMPVVVIDPVHVL